MTLIITTILLFFFPFIMYPIIGFSKNFKYNKDIIVSKNGPIDLNNSNTNFSNQSNDINKNFNEKKYCNCCGNTINNNDKYCRSCGNKIND